MLEREQVSVVGERGEGRAFVVLFEQGAFEPLAQALYDKLSGSGRIVLVQSTYVTDSNWEDLTRQLLKVFDDRSIRQASLVSFGDAGALAQNLCLYEIKMVRSLVLVDAATRAHPNFFVRMIDVIEDALPLGLPLRSHDRGFDSKPFLQRIRCPVLVVTSPSAGAHLRSQALVFERRLPTCWRTELTTEGLQDQLVKIIEDFQQVRAKCPQKAVGRGEVAGPA